MSDVQLRCLLGELRCLLGINAPPRGSQIRKIVDAAVDAFMRAHAAG
jgi:hypothetical protein